SVWRWMARIVHARSGFNNLRDRLAVDSYVRHQLGRRNRATFLTELSPFPRSDLMDERWIRLLSRDERMFEKLVASRTEKLMALLEESRPQLVICYGWKHKQKFQNLFRTLNWKTVLPKVTMSENGQCLVLPFLGNGQMNFTLFEALVERRLFGRA
ncbi:MAG: hypothetical protein ACJ8EN_23475, partial [Xanthobacteraceae bacterium]